MNWQNPTKLTPTLNLLEGTWRPGGGEEETGLFDRGMIGTQVVGLGETEHLWKYKAKPLQVHS